MQLRPATFFAYLPTAGSTASIYGRTVAVPADAAR